MGVFNSLVCYECVVYEYSGGVRILWMYKSGGMVFSKDATVNQ